MSFSTLLIPYLRPAVIFWFTILPTLPYMYYPRQILRPDAQAEAGAAGRERQRLVCRPRTVLHDPLHWLLTGDEDKKDFPADKALINWLWQHPEVREELWNRMKEKSD